MCMLLYCCTPRSRPSFGFGFGCMIFSFFCFLFFVSVWISISPAFLLNSLTFDLATLSAFPLDDDDDDGDDEFKMTGPMPFPASFSFFCFVSAPALSSFCFCVPSILAVLHPVSFSRFLIRLQVSNGQILYKKVSCPIYPLSLSCEHAALLFIFSKPRPFPYTSISHPPAMSCFFCLSAFGARVCGSV